MSKKRVLVFPCGSEIGLELHRSLRYSRHFELVGASSVEDNGEVVFSEYISNAPFLNDDGFSDWLQRTVNDHDIDIIFPAMDQAFTKIKKMESSLNVNVVGHSAEVCELCSSKVAMYKFLEASSILPYWTDNIDDIKQFPVFAKPDVGYGSRGVMQLSNREQLYSARHILEATPYVYCEYLPGDEYTVDCFTDRHQRLLFAGARRRTRVLNGISARTEPVQLTDEFLDAVAQLNNKIPFRGAWFCQFKRDINGQLKLLEVAARFGGSSSLYRVKGINFALLTLFDYLGYDVNVLENDINLIQERSLDIKFKTDINFDHVYVDYDDCLIIDGKYNYKLMSLLYKFKDELKKVYLISRHELDLSRVVNMQFAPGFFDSVIHITDQSPKSAYIQSFPAIFIDDSNKERQDVAEVHKIPVFSPDGLDLFNL